MKKIFVASTNQDLINTVEKACKHFPNFFSAFSMPTTETSISYINYEIPEIKVLDYTSKEIDCGKILEAINADEWLHYGGIIAVCKDDDQVKLIEYIKDDNILSILPMDDFKNNFEHLLDILYQNQQFFYTRGMQDIIGRQEEGSFVCSNNPMDLKFYTNFLVSYLYNTNRVTDNDRVGLQLTLMELLMNAVEHGNLNISYEEKSKWLSNGGDMLSLIEKKNKEPQNKNKKIKISYAIRKKASAFRIKDDGNGFDWRKYLNKKTNTEELHGRGISLSKSCIHQITYNEKGNQVTFSILNKADTVNTVPGIMKPFPTIEYKDRQIICKQDEISNDLFFIVSGNFNVYTNNKLTATLTANDIFIGEMAFLLNDRRTATVVANGKCTLIKVPKTDFLTLIRKNPHYGIFLSKMLAQRLVLQAQTTYIFQEKIEELQATMQQFRTILKK